MDGIFLFSLPLYTLVCKGMTMSINSLCEFLYLTVCYILSRHIEDVENSKNFLLVSLLWKLNILLCVDGIFLSFLLFFTCLYVKGWR